jgi:hypothetical protein
MLRAKTGAGGSRFSAITATALLAVLVGCARLMARPCAGSASTLASDPKTRLDQK